MATVLTIFNVLGFTYLLIGFIMAQLVWPRLRGRNGHRWSGVTAFLMLAWPRGVAQAFRD